MDTAVFTSALGKLLKETNPMDLLLRTVQTAVMVALILIIFSFIQTLAGRFLRGRIGEQRVFMVRKGIRYTGMIMALLFVFRAMGIDTSALLGAAGVAGIVLGFAAQASMTSFISGLFLLSEKPFQVGDTVKVEDITGVVLSVDLLSVKLKTFDNLFVRIPNETIIKGKLINVSRFPLRRLDISFSVAYKEDLEQVRGILLNLAAGNPHCLKEPAPFFGIDRFDSSGIALLFCLWFEQSRHWDLRNSIIMAIKKRFEAEDIEIPYQKIDINISRLNGGPEGNGEAKAPAPPADKEYT